MHLFHNYSDVMMSAMVSPIIGVSIVFWTVCSGADQRKHKKIRVTCLCEGISPVTGEFPTQRSCNAENVSFDDVIMIIPRHWNFVACWDFHGRQQHPNFIYQLSLLWLPTQIERFMGQTWANLGPVGPRWAPCWPHESCYQGISGRREGPGH